MISICGMEFMLTETDFDEIIQKKLDRQMERIERE